MKYLSTRSGSSPVDFTDALFHGLAPDGGLYLPESIPTLPPDWRNWGYAASVSGSLGLFGAVDTAGLVSEAAASFSHPEVAPLVEVGDLLVLELFWGPTLSFKDHALQVVARLLARGAVGGTVLVATSGDTGSAAIEACRGSLPIVVLYPEGRVAELQRRQMTTVDDPGVRVVGVRGTFDQCQDLVKEAFSTQPGLLSVNSINFARVAAQVGYYLHAAARIGEPFEVVVPTGNFGNAYSCWMARQMGAPVERVVIANNANHYLADLIGGVETANSGVLPTVAPAMDIQRPSNLERLPQSARSDFGSGWADDDSIRSAIATVDREHHYLLDPHTAAAWKVASEQSGDAPRLVVSTAHPGKFADVVSAAIGRTIDLPPPLASLASTVEHQLVIEPDLEHLIEVIEDM